ncbi:MAG: DUF2461 domain-containing protein [Saprospiraceae bacterium]|nr:DUF2461 domain-containing protein [Saprospiraceae bacterium]
MEYFTEDFRHFFHELQTNNSKDWFDQNRKRYRKSIKEPFEKFLVDLIDQMRAFDPSLNILPKDCMLRINRDIRFSKDKTPYNTHYTTFVSATGKKDKSMPGLFLRFSADTIGIMGGCYMPNKDQLHNIRSAIASDPSEFRKIIGEPEFASKFGQIRGEEHKRIPKEFQAAAVSEPLLAKKQFYFMSEVPATIIPTKKLLPTILKFWHTARPLNNYLKKAMKYGI